MASSFVTGILQILAFLVLLVFRTVDILLQDLFRGLWAITGRCGVAIRQKCILGTFFPEDLRQLPGFASCLLVSCFASFIRSFFPFQESVKVIDHSTGSHRASRKMKQAPAVPVVAPPSSRG
jgi:hypothetical protein